MREIDRYVEVGIWFVVYGAIIGFGTFLLNCLAPANDAVEHATVFVYGATGLAVIWYTIETRWLRVETEERNRRDRQPILVIDDEQVEGTGQLQLYTKNVGYGPALNIVVRVEESPSQFVKVVGAGDKETLPFATGAEGPDNMVPIRERPGFHCFVEYDDIFGSHYQTVYKNRRHFFEERTQRRIPWEEVSIL